MQLSQQKWLWVLILAPLSIWLLWKGFRNEKDTAWSDTQSLLEKNYFTLENAQDSVGALFRRFHNDNTISDSAVFQLVSQPYTPTMTWDKFREYFKTFTERRSAIVIGVTGTGKTRLLDCITNVIVGEVAANTEGGKKIQIMCAPQFDLDLHRRYIGYYEGKNFVKGELLKFWDLCRTRPNERFVCLIDNFDKINPETFFGPQLWEKLDDAKFNVVLGKDTIQIPDNFYLLAITHSGVGQKIELTNEHLKRFGGQIILPPTAVELVLYLKGKRKEVEKDLVKKQAELAQKPSEKLSKDIAKLEKQAQVLRDTAHLQRFVYFFTKTNEMIGEKYSQSHQLGQWSDVRKKFMPDELVDVQTTFTSHVNSFHPQAELRNEDFKGIHYTLNNEGSLQNTSPVWKAVDKLAELGFASELGVAGSFALVSGIFGWFYFRRRHKTIKDYTGRVYAVMDEFTKGQRGYDDLRAEINAIKREFDDMVLEQKVNYNEASFFYGFLEDKSRQIEFAREVNESFLKLVDVFLEDNVLTEGEYAKLKQFLESIKNKLGTAQYVMYKNQIEEIYQKFGAKK
jgi:hypothetical protein